MGLWDKLFSKNKKNDDFKEAKLYQILNKYLGQGRPIFGVERNEDFIKKGYMMNPDVYSVINLITKAASGVPFELHEVKDKKNYTKYKSFKQGGNLPSTQSEYYKTKSLEQVYKNDLLHLLQNPNPLQGEVEFTENVLGYKLLTGNAYINCVKPKNGINKGITKQLYNLPPHLTEIISGTNTYEPVSGYKMTAYNTNIQFEKDEIIHMKYWNPDFSTAGSHLYGMSPLKAFSRVIQVSNDSYNGMASLLQNLGAVGILSGVGEKDDYSEEQLLNLKQKYKESYKGSDRLGEIIISSSQLNWQKMGMSVEDLGILEAKKYNLRDICNAYGINSALLNDPDNKVYANAKEARRGLYIDVVIPLLDSYIAELNRTIVKEYSERDGKEYVLSYDINSIPELQTDLKELRDSIKDIWELTPNERRVVMGFPKDDVNPSMDEYWVPANFFPMSQNIPTQEDTEIVKILKKIEYGD